MARPTWRERELVLLEAISAGAEAGERVNAADLAETTGLGKRETELGLQALYEADFIGGIVSTTQGDIFDLMNIRLLERGLRTVGQWPPEEQYDAMLEILEERIGSAATQEERTRVEKLRDGVVAVGKDVLVSVLSAWARHLGGPPL